MRNAFKFLAKSLSCLDMVGLENSPRELTKVLRMIGFTSIVLGIFLPIPDDLLLLRFTLLDIGCVLAILEQSFGSTQKDYREIGLRVLRHAMIFFIVATPLTLMGWGFFFQLLTLPVTGILLLVGCAMILIGRTS